MNPRAALPGTVVILLNVIVTYAHDRAHGSLGVHLNVLQTIYAYTVIAAAPLLALVLLWTPKVGAGGLLLAASMAGSLAFATFFHYVHVSPDHVNHLPAGEAQGLFRMTAALMVPAEILGVAVGVWIWRAASRPSGPARPPLPGRASA